MKPCGLSSDVMTNIERLVGEKVSVSEFQKSFEKELLSRL